MGRDRLEDNFGLINDKKNNYIPNHLISKIHLDEIKDYDIVEYNKYPIEGTALFGSHMTNLSEYFKKNPTLFECKVADYLPYSKGWKNVSDCYNNFSYQ
jgi:hypothetical protein